ncbi:MAG: fructosamine kinase family protein [Actinomycetaceae bacterium]|nr:fructosamine kinase family protein [Actinomycetaceae bacterium]
MARQDIFRKTDHRETAIAHEVASLRWLADAGPDAVRVVPVLDSGPTWIDEPRLRSTRPSTRDAEDFGRRLAFTHAAGASHFGAPPAGLSASHGHIGGEILPLTRAGRDSSPSWGDFFARYRIAPYIERSPFTPSERATIEDLCARLSAGDCDHAQPAMVEEAHARDRSIGAARIHGDLWSGNVMWTPDQGAVLIDPAAHGGHAEDDLAALHLFGCPHLDRIMSAYNEVSPLAHNWKERITLHQMHLLMVHCALFGRGYCGETVAIARRWAGR